MAFRDRMGKSGRSKKSQILLGVRIRPSILRIPGFPHPALARISAGDAENIPDGCLSSDFGP
jgi:hypothetical protein